MTRSRSFITNSLNTNQMSMQYNVKIYKFLMGSILVCLLLQFAAVFIIVLLLLSILYDIATLFIGFKKYLSHGRNYNSALRKGAVCLLVGLLTLYPAKACKIGNDKAKQQFPVHIGRIQTGFGSSSFVGSSNRKTTRLY